MNVTELCAELQRLAGEGLGDFRLYITPSNALADRNHRAGEAGVVITFRGGDYPVESVSSDYGDPDDAGYVFLQFGEPVWPVAGPGADPGSAPS
jgi:hypothetical protein